MSRIDCQLCVHLQALILVLLSQKIIIIAFLPVPASIATSTSSTLNYFPYNITIQSFYCRFVWTLLAKYCCVCFNIFININNYIVLTYILKFCDTKYESYNRYRLCPKTLYTHSTVYLLHKNLTLRWHILRYICKTHIKIFLRSEWIEEAHSDR